MNGKDAVTLSQDFLRNDPGCLLWQTSAHEGQDILGQLLLVAGQQPVRVALILDEPGVRQLPGHRP